MGQATVRVELNCSKVSWRKPLPAKVEQNPGTVSRLRKRWTAKLKRWERPLSARVKLNCSTVSKRNKPLSAKVELNPSTVSR